jgi:colanic acid biosynthesis glycosyl transferase WcaI
VTVVRHWLRVRPRERFLDKALYEFSFTAISAPTALRRARQADVLLCVVPCVSAAAMSAMVLGRSRARSARPRLVLWVQDLVLRLATSLDGIGPLARRMITTADRLERVAFRSADGIVVCSPSFADHAERLGVERDRVTTIYNWVDLDRVAAVPPPPQTTATRFLYAGNLGYTQGFETLIEAARLVGDDIQVEIVGAGNSADEVRRLAATTTNVRVSPPVPERDYAGLLASADAHVVIQREVSANANFPSKIASCLASGRPVVASIPLDSAAASALIESSGALVVPPEMPEALAEAMRHLRARPELRRTLGLGARAYAEEHFGRDNALLRLEAVLLGDRAAGSFSHVSELSENGAGSDVRLTGSGTTRART